MEQSYLTKIGKNEYRVDFETNVNVVDYKSVIVDGEKYTREIRSKYHFNSKTDFDSKNSYWHKIIVDEFQPYNGQIYTVWNYTAFCKNPISCLSGYSSSENEYVRLLFALFHFEHINGILEIGNFKTNDYSKLNTISEMLMYRMIKFPLYKYGFNNGLYVGVNLFYFLKINFISKINTDFYNECLELSNDFISIFPKKLFTKKLSKCEYNEIAINILNKSINLKLTHYETSKQ